MDFRNITPPILALASISSATSELALELDSSHFRVNLVSTKVLADGSSSAVELFTFDSLAGGVSIDGQAFTAGVRTIDLDIDVDMHGNQMSYTVPVLVTADDSSVIAFSEQPLLIDCLFV